MHTQKTPHQLCNVILLVVWKVWYICRLGHTLTKKKQIEKKKREHPHRPSHRDTTSFLVVWKAARSVWHWLLSANSTLGAALAGFAANPGKEITDTHNAAFCSSAKKKTSPLSPQKKKAYTQIHTALAPSLHESTIPPSSPGTQLLVCASRSGSLTHSRLVTWTIQPPSLYPGPQHCCALLLLASFK